VQRALLRAGSTPSAEEAEHFYALRVSDYARTLAVVFGGLYVAGALLVLFALPGQFITFHLHPAKLANLGFALGAFSIWRFVRRPECPLWVAMLCDVAMPLSVTVSVALVAGTVPAVFALYLAPILFLALVLVLRAALIPSPPVRTLVVGAVASLPVTWTTYVLSARDPQLPAPFTPALLTGGALVWCVGLSGVTALVSSVIYGLHRQVESAKKLGQYVLGELIGEGGMGAVYHAQHAMLRRPTAVKLLSAERAGPESIQRFEREVRLTARLTHPNTVAIYDYGRTPDGVFYYAMEYLDGLSLEQLVERYGPQPAGRVIHILLQATGALAEAHGLGLIHRDIKPANILFCERGGAPDTVKLVDFGLVKNLAPSENPELTHAGAITGTPLYLAPESILDPAGVDHRVDLYALGGVGYFLLTGQPPFLGRSVLEICGHHLHTAPEPPSERLGERLPADLEALVLRCLAKKPEDRPRDAQALHDALLECQEASPWSLAEARAFWQQFRASSAPSGAPARPSGSG
jgi:eukaryotic-like serine/threonine-protein kinase